MSTYTAREFFILIGDGGVVRGSIVCIAYALYAAAGWMLGGPVDSAICLGLSGPTGGGSVLACGLVLVGVGAFGGGYLGSKGGEFAAELIYENSR